MILRFIFYPLDEIIYYAGVYSYSAAQASCRVGREAALEGKAGMAGRAVGQLPPRQGRG